MRRTITLVCALLAGLATLTSPRVGADAPAQAPPESGLQCINLKPNSCWAHQVVFRGDPMLEFYNWTKSTWPKGFSYEFDGCSADMAQKALDYAGPLLGLGGLLLRERLDHYVDVFRPACRIHDFGYWNFGSGTEKGFKQYAVDGDLLTERQQGWGETTTKGHIDHRFGDLMRRVCEDKEGDGFVCNVFADAFEWAVRRVGTID